MANTNRASFSLENIQKSAGTLIERDRVALDRVERDREERRTIQLDLIQERHENTRSINAEHAAALMESIQALGLIEPLVIDTRGRLLAGAHRLTAIRALRESSPDLFQKHFAAGIPVRQMAFDAEKDAAHALDVEVAENEFRRDYTREEIKSLVGRLRGAGYRETVGRPKEGEKAIGPALQVIIHKSLRTVRRLVAELDAEEKPTKKKPKETTRERESRVALQKALGIKAKVQDKKGRVTVTLFCSSYDELDELLGKVSAS